MIHPVEEKDRVVNTANALLETARESSATVVHCVMDMNAQPAETSKTRQRWESSYKPLAVSALERLEFIAELAPATKGSSAKESVVARLPGCVSAMKTPGFVSSLREKYGVESVVICGLISSEIWRYRN
ncbi:Isochorismatase-like protein [Metarhizium guizhouense ARSEF 977]|uniref:Isochorismatase-like protein n=1 Tax=Metarhizium guizhouense (strain ARSEF 977) TaxID=1276136 RepID=A0A0B4H806_METGA|nr:Isochorismatase-like protein [Metarhizium guizhouense ARSEF 977]